MLKMLDSLARLTRPHGALLNSEEEDALLEDGGQSESDPTERIFRQTSLRGCVQGHGGLWSKGQ